MGCAALTEGRTCPHCGQPVTGRSRKAYCGRDCYRASLDQLRADRLGVLMNAVARTGLTVTAGELRRRCPDIDVRRHLASLVEGGRVAVIGDRYFPASWLTDDRL